MNDAPSLGPCGKRRADVILPILRRHLVIWYEKNKRDLPWRQSQDPYAVWISEMMLQQTQVQTVIPYFKRWMASFPTIERLARANLDDVLKLWEGLGYYARARNLHKAAQTILRKFKGEIPQTSAELIRLPGIGPYSARAIASIAFNEDAAVVDGNVRRVIILIFLVEDDVEGIQEKADALLFKGKAGLFNQALMELGATLCSPRSPQCSFCPVQTLCQASLKGVQKDFPPISRRLEQKEVRTLAGLIRLRGKILIRRRPPKGLLGGLWEIPSFQAPGKDHHPEALRNYFCKHGLQITHLKRLNSYRHIYTHFKETLDLYACKADPCRDSLLNVSNWRWIKVTELENFALTGVSGKIKRDLLKSTVKEHRKEYSLKPRK